MADVLEVEETEVQEHFFEAGWTDGLPIVPPTPDRVEAMLAYGGVADPNEVLGSVPQRSIDVTAEHLAINAVMAGCRPEYFPILLAGAAAMLDPAFNLNAVITSTGGAALCVVVSGPLADEIGMNARHNCLGSGNRANATIGRALRLVCGNVLGAKTGGMDGSSFGHPGKLTMCFAEDPPPPPWRPIRVELGCGDADTTVTVLPVEAPRQVANHLNGDPEGLLRTVAAAARNPSHFSAGKGFQAIVALGPEHAAAIIDGGWTRQRAAEFLAEHSRITPGELEAAGVPLERGAQHDMEPGPDGKLPCIASAADVLIVTAGGAGPGWSAYIPCWAPTKHTRMTTRRVRPPGEGLPDCGPDGCLISWD
jgi:hypothetical protein